MIDVSRVVNLSISYLNEPNITGIDTFALAHILPQDSRILEGSLDTGLLIQSNSFISVYEGERAPEVSLIVDGDDMSLDLSKVLLVDEPTSVSDDCLKGLFNVMISLDEIKEYYPKTFVAPDTVQYTFVGAYRYSHQPQGIMTLPPDFELDDTWISPVRRTEWDSTKNVCTHEWESYTGLSEQFTFCKKCDIKEKDL